MRKTPINKITTILCFLCYIGLANAQIDSLALQKEMATMSSEELIEKIKETYAQENYLLSLRYAQQALKVTRQQYGEQDEKYLEGLADIAEIWRKLDNYPKALALLEEVYEKAATFLDIEHPDYVEYQVALGNMYRRMGRYKEATTLYLKGLDLIDDTHKLYTAYAGNLLVIYRKLGQYQKAIPLYQKVLTIVAQTKGKTHKRYGLYLNNLALVYQELGQYEEAITLYKQALDITEQAEGKESTNYAKWLGNLGLVHQNMGAYEYSITLIQQALDIIENKVGKTHSAYVRRAGNLAFSYKQMGQYQKAVQLYESSLNGIANKLGKQHPSYANLLSNLGSVYREMGYYEKAEPLFKTSLEILQNTLGKQHSAYAKGLTNLAGFYYDIGVYDKALPLFLRTLTISEKSDGETHPNYGIKLNNLAALYRKIGQWEQATIYQQAALDNVLLNFGKEHPTYTNRLINLAAIYSQSNKLEEATILLEEALTINKKILKKEHPDYGNNLASLAINYTQLGRYDEAETLLVEAIQNAEQKVGKQHDDYISRIAALANLYTQNENIPNALDLYEEAISLATAVLGNQHPNTGSYTIALATLYAQQQQYDKAFPLFVSAAENFQLQLANYYPAISEQERITFLHSLEKDLHQLYSFARHYPAISTTIQDLQLNLKGLALAGTKTSKNFITNSVDSTLQADYLQWNALRRQIAQASTRSVKEQTARGWSIPDLQKEARLLEGKLARYSATLMEEFKDKKEQAITVAELKNKLKRKERAIDIFHFQYHNGKTWTDSTFYYALVTAKQSKQPSLVYLGEQKAIARILRARIRAGGANYIENQRISNDLYQLIWKPLLPTLKKAKRIYLSPTGLLHQVTFSSLQDQVEGNNRLIDQYELAYFGTLRDYVLQKKEAIKTNASISLVGGALYDMDSIDLVKKVLVDTNTIEEIPITASTNNAFVALRSITEDSIRSAIRFNYLPGTLEEVNHIAQQFQAKQWQAQTFVGEKATEDNVKTLNGSNTTHIIHLSTHGYFFPARKTATTEMADNLRNRIRFADNPLLRSGLVFTGVNHTWEGGKAIEGIEDGLLTAYEIANMDLQHTQLVTLSACQTAQGDIQNGEGVFGLQRAFKTAGVNNLLVSLWKVPDKETAQLMQLFYQYYLEGTPPRKALQKAQKRMSADYSPFYWAAFILIE